VPAQDQQVERVAPPDEWRGAARRIGWAFLISPVFGSVFLGASR
jgi:hypothetical protein